MIDLESLKTMWSEDSKIDEDVLDIESLKIPQLHSKYLNFLSDFKLIKTQKEYEYKILLREKWEYYSGRADVEIYKENPFDIKVLKQDLPIYLDSDKDLQKLQYKIFYYKELVNFLEKVLENINIRGFQIKNCIDWQKFMQGV